MIPDSPESPDPSPPGSPGGGYSPISPGYSPAPSPPGSPVQPVPHRLVYPPPNRLRPQLPSGFIRRPVATRDASTQLRTILRAATPPLYLHTRRPEDPTRHFSIVPSWGVKVIEKDEKREECVICYRENGHMQVNKK